MASTRDIRRRIKSVKNTRQITKAMELVAASKMKKAQQAALAGRPYADEIAALTRTGADPALLGVLSPMADSGAPTGAQLRDLLLSTGQARLVEAGHMLGSAMLVLDIVEGARKVRFLFSGDLGRDEHPILVAPDPVPAGHFDAIICESTYGDRAHENLGH